MSQNDEVIYIETGGLKRRYVIHLPTKHSNTPTPMILMLDGRGGTPWTAVKITGWSQKADQESFIAVYPEAIRLNPDGPQHFLDNPQMWNVGSTIYDQHTIEIDDVAFLRAVIADVKRRFVVDSSRIYMTGFSNGAAMTFRFAIESPGLLTAIAPVSGYFYQENVVIKKSIPTIYFTGTDDPLNPFHGGLVQLPWGKTVERPPIRQCLEKWLTLSNASIQPKEILESNGVLKEVYDKDIIFYAVQGLGHVWPGGHRILPEKIVGKTSDKINATNIIWDFFRSSCADVL